MITRLIAILALLLVTVGADAKRAKAQCTGTFPANTVCGNATTTTGQPKPTAATSFSSGGSGGGTAGITRAQISSTNLTNFTTLTVNGYAAANDLGYGATYSQTGATCPNGLNAVKDSVGNCFNQLVTTSTAMNPGWFGAKADNGATTISSGDVSAHTEWRGTYTAGKTWDYVGTQEAIYAAFANASTPGSIVWNAASSATTLNYVLFVPPGQYGINATLTIVAQGFSIRFAQRQGSLWNWTGAAGTTMVLFNTASYGRVENFSVQCTVATNYGSQVPCVELDAISSPAALLTQELTFDSMWLFVGHNGQGMSVNRVDGGSGQGDTITLINPYLAGDAYSSDYAIGLFGGNTLQLNILGGDCNGFPHQCILDNGGVHYSRGLHFENQNGQSQGFFAAPALNQIVTAGADVNSIGGNSGNGSIVTEAARSEAEILSQNSGGSQGAVYSSIVTEADAFTWGASGTLQNGLLTYAGTKARGFIVVDNGGACSQWCAITSVAGNVLTDSAATYTVNQWAGFWLWMRFGSNGFLQKCLISSNTATTITVSGGGGCASISTETLYMIAGLTGGSPPSWDSATTATEPVSSGNIITTHATSNCIELSSGFLATNIWVVIPYADLVPATSTGVSVPNALYAQVTGTSGAACSWGGSGPSATLNKNAGASIVAASGNYPANNFFFGTGLTDNNITWLQVPIDAISGAASVVDMQTKHGTVVTTPGASLGLSSAFTPNPITLSNGQFLAPSNGKQFLTNYLPGNISTWSCALTAAATIDLTNCVGSASILTLTPGQNETLNAPAPNGVSQYLTILITTSGTTSYTVTFGSNFLSTGTLQTGAVSGATYAVTFVSMNITVGGKTGWYEIARSAAPAAGTNAVVASPAGPNSTGAVTMQGLAGTITPVRTGNISITISGYVISSNVTAGDGLTNQISYGTGAAPTTNAALAGTQVGGVQQYLNPTTVTAADVSQPFALTATVTGLTIGTAYWIDLASEAIAHTGLANKNVNIAVHEF